MSFVLPPVIQEASIWLMQRLPEWSAWNTSVDLEIARTQKAITAYGLEFTILTPAQVNALTSKREGFLYACSGDPSGGAGGSGFYQWTASTSTWSKFA